MNSRFSQISLFLIFWKCFRKKLFFFRMFNFRTQLLRNMVLAQKCPNCSSSLSELILQNPNGFISGLNLCDVITLLSFVLFSLELHHAEDGRNFFNQILFLSMEELRFGFHQLCYNNSITINYLALPMRNREIDLSLSASLLDSRILKNKSKELPKTRTPAVPRTRKARLHLSILRKVKRIKNVLLGPVPLPQSQDQHEYQYFKTNKQPQITLSNLSLIIFTPVLVWMHIKVASSYAIPIVQYLFASVFVAFIYNLIAIIRAHQLMPYLPNKDHDTQLKIICVLNVVALFISIFVGWNGSGGMVFAVIWQFLRGNRGIFYMIIFGVIIGGSITMEKQITLLKLIRFIPGLLYGYISAQLFTLRQSSPYAIANQILLLMTLCLPFGYMFSTVIVPSFKQWLVMILSGLSLLFMVLMSIKLMQNQRVSIVMGITSGIIVIATSTFIGVSDYVAFLMITLSILILLKLEYLDAD